MIISRINSTKMIAGPMQPQDPLFINHSSFICVQYILWLYLNYVYVLLINITTILNISTNPYFYLIGLI